MAKRQVIRKTKDSIKVEVEIFVVKEGDFFVAYCPALQVSSYGNTGKDAKKGFDGALNIFINETEKRGSFEKVLLKMGWSLKQVPAPLYIPPRSKTAYYSKFRYKKPTDRFQETVALPL